VSDQQEWGIVLVVAALGVGFLGSFYSFGCCGLAALMLIAGIALIATDRPAPQPAYGQPMYPPYPYGPGPAPYPVAPPRRVPFCTNCGAPSGWIPQYSRWYCGNCRQYLSESVPPPDRFG